MVTAGTRLRPVRVGLTRWKLLLIEYDYEPAVSDDSGLGITSTGDGHTLPSGFPSALGLADGSVVGSTDISGHGSAERGGDGSAETVAAAALGDGPADELAADELAADELVDGDGARGCVLAIALVVAVGLGVPPDLEVWAALGVSLAVGASAGQLPLVRPSTCARVVTVHDEPALAMPVAANTAAPARSAEPTPTTSRRR